MSEYLEADRDGFTEYAINDAMIACLHIEQVIKYECIEGGNPHLSFTIGSLSVKAFKETLLERYKEIFNIEEDVTLKDESFKEYFNSIFAIIFEKRLSIVQNLLS